VGLQSRQAIHSFYVQILSFCEEPLGGVNGPSSDASCTTQFSGFYMNSLAVMNTCQAMGAKFDSTWAFCAFWAILVVKK